MEGAVQCMGIEFTRTTAVIPSADLKMSLEWWIEICGFTEVFRDATPPSYAGIARGNASIHLSRITDPNLARTVGEQTMLRIAVTGIDAFYAEYGQRGGIVHPNGALQQKPWGSREFSAVDPCGVCVTFCA